MTDVMSEAFGRELNARTTFEKEAVWLPLLAVHALNGGAPTQRGKTFTDCLIEGPGVIAVLDGCAFDECNMGAVTDPNSLFFKPQGPVAVGVVGMAECRFLRCTFRQIGLISSDDFQASMVGSMVSTTKPGNA